MILYTQHGWARQQNGTVRVDDDDLVAALHCYASAPVGKEAISVAFVRPSVCLSVRRERSEFGRRFHNAN